MAYPFILYNNIFASGLTATDTEDGYSVDNIYDMRPYTAWQAGSSGTKYITMDAGAAVDVDSLCIIAHNLGTASATISLESSSTGAWGGEEVEQIAGFDPSDDKAIAKTFTLATARYWRVKIVTASVAAQIGCINLGAKMEFPVFPDSPFTLESQKMNVTANNPRGGHLLQVTNYYTPLAVNVSFSLVLMAFIDGDYDKFWENHGRSLKPFFWCPNLTDFPRGVFFVRMAEGMQHGVAQIDTTYAERLDLRMVGIAE